MFWPVYLCQVTERRGDSRSWLLEPDMAGTWIGNRASKKVSDVQGHYGGDG